MFIYIIAMQDSWPSVESLEQTSALNSLSYAQGNMDKLFDVLSLDDMSLQFEFLKLKDPIKWLQDVTNNFIYTLPWWYKWDLVLTKTDAESKEYINAVHEVFTSLGIDEKNFILRMHKREELVTLFMNYYDDFAKDREWFDAMQRGFVRRHKLPKHVLYKDPNKVYEKVYSQIYAIDELCKNIYLGLRKKWYTHSALCA